jgi:hypothetical protein
VLADDSLDMVYALELIARKEDGVLVIVGLGFHDASQCRKRQWRTVGDGCGTFRRRDCAFLAFWLLMLEGAGRGPYAPRKTICVQESFSMSFVNKKICRP